MIIVIVILHNVTATAQTPLWIVYNTSNSGLPDNSVVSLAIDASSTKWVGTNNSGLAKFDGKSWVVYNTTNSGLPDNNVTSIAIDSSGNKWMGTFNGVAKFDSTTWTIYNPDNSGLPGSDVTSITIEGSATKWIGTYWGIAKYDGSTWSVYNHANSGLPDDYINAIAIDGSGNKWIGTGSAVPSAGGLAKFDGTAWTVYNTSNSGLPDNYVTSIAIDGSGNKWIGTFNGGLAKFGGTTWHVYTSEEDGLPSDYITSIHIDTNGDVWVGTNNGIAIFDTGTWTIYNSNNSGLPNNFIWAIVSDPSGNKWIGTYAGVAAFYESGFVPVELTSFTANLSKKQVNLKWETATEINSASFEIEKQQVSSGKINTDKWQLITSVKAYGNSNSPKYYSFADKNITAGRYNYRLKMIDNDGSYKYSSTVEVDDDTPGMILLEQNYPNPFNPSTSIGYSVPVKGYVTLKVYDLFGSEVANLVERYMEPGSYSAVFNATGYASGMYIYKLQVNEMQISKKLTLLK